MTATLEQLLFEETKEELYARALTLATGLGLPVTSWQPGDPTRSLYHLEAEILEILEAVVVGFISSGFLEYSHGDWHNVCAKQGFNVDVPSATFAGTDILLTNAGGGVYDLDPGDLTVKSSVSGKTYRNTTGGHIAASSTLTVSVVADEAGSDSSAGAGEIDTLVTGLLGVTCSNAAAAIGIDEQDEATTTAQCHDKLDALSPDGAKGAYSYVARNPVLTGTSAVTRARVYSDSETGDVTMYVAGPAGAVSSPDVDLVTTAIATYATPLCITPTVISASNVTQVVTYTVWIYKSCGKTATEVRADILTALEALVAASPIGGDIIPPATTGSIYVSQVESSIRSAFPTKIFRVSVATPSGDIALTNGQVIALGTVTGTVNLVADP